MKRFTLFGSVLLLLISCNTKNQEKRQTRLFMQLDTRLRYFVEKTENKVFGEARCIDTAKGIADFFIEKLPGDKVSYRGYNDLKIPNIYNDASVAAIKVAVLFELAALYVEANTLYLDTANTTIKSLNSKKRYAFVGTNSDFLILHNMGIGRKKYKVDVPINYSDYYYLEILKRQNKL